MSACPPPPTTSDNPRDYEIIYQTNVKGDIKIIGNSVLCQKNGSVCKSDVDAGKSNNEIDTLFHKLSSDSGNAEIQNSTSYTFALPAGVTKNDVMWAGLYWQAGIKGTPTSTQIANARKVKLKAPGDSAYRDITAETVNGDHTNRFNWIINTSQDTAWYYQGVRDVTGIVQSAGAGTYQVANVEATYGDNYSPGHFGGWAIVIVYKDSSATLKNVTVYDGFNSVNNGHSVSATLSGFLTPSGGTVDSKFMIFGSEGDRNDYYQDKISITRDSETGTAYYLKDDGTASTSSGNYNPMNSSITQTGSDSRVPNYTNVIGIDIDTYNVGTSDGGLGIIRNGQSSTKITLSTNDDVYNPGVFAFATQIYAPNIEITKVPSTSGTLAKGQQIDYTGSFTNSGLETAKDVVIYDDFTLNVLKRTDGNDTDPAVTLADLLDRNATKIKRSIRLSSANSTSTWHCAQGLSGLAGCSDYTADCSVDYTGDPETGATKVWCSLPTVAVGDTYTMKFSLNLSDDPQTYDQNVSVSNTMYAGYKNNQTDDVMPESASNTADAGDYNTGGGGSGTVVIPPYQNEYGCGMFGSVLTTYDWIYSGLDHPANNDQACYTGSISYPQSHMTGEITCNPDGCGGANSCERAEPPANKLEYTVQTSSRLGTDEGSPSGTLTGSEYGDFNGKFDLTLAPATTYGPMNTPVMVLGDVTLSDSNTLTLAPGDYFFHSLTFTKNNAAIVLSGGGPVRIFIQNNLTVEKNGLNINAAGIPDNLFVYIKGNLEALTNGAIEVWKGFFYVEGTARLDANSNNMAIYGGITAEGPIIIEGNNGNFYQQGDATDIGYGECAMCYSDIKAGGMSLNLLGCGGVGTFSNIKVPVQNISGVTLTETTVSEAHTSDFSFSFLSTNNVLDNNNNPVGTATEVNSGWNAGAMGMDMSLFSDKAIIYDLGTYAPTNESNYKQLHSSSTSNLGLDLCEWKSSLAYVANYNDNVGRHYNVVMEACTDTTVSTQYVSGPFDGWDIFRDDVTDPPDDRNISTKIVNQPFRLSLASMNKGDDAYETKYGAGSTVQVAVYPKNSTIPVSNVVTFDANTTAHVAESAEFTVPKAVPEAYLGFKLCATFEQNATVNELIYYLFPAESCTNAVPSACDVTSSVPVWRVCPARDDFAIRPKAFAADTNLSSGTIIKAGQTFEMRYGGVDWNDNLAADYNETVGSTFDVNVTERKSGCIVGAFDDDIQTGWQYADGNKTIMTKYAEVGVIDINVTEYTKPITSRFAAVDADDTPESNLTIENAGTTLSFVPDRFELSWDFRNANGGDFTYYENNATSMGGRLDLNVTAVAADGNTTANYSADCYSQNSVAKLALGYDNLSDPIRPRWMDDGNTSHAGPSTLSVRPAMMDIGIGAEEFEDGNVSAHFSINFERNETVPLLPNTLTISNIDVNDTNGTFGALAQNQDAYYVYGRLFPRDARVFGPTLPAVASAAYEVYGAPAIGATPLPRSRFDGMWYTNVFHDDPADGDASVTQLQSNGAASAALTPAVEGNAAQGVETYDLGTHAIGGYKAHVATDPWLWYGPNALGYADPVTGNTAADCLHHPCFNITVVPAVGASGSARSGSEDVKQRKKSDQGSGWRSTSDYAPAI